MKSYRVLSQCSFVHNPLVSGGKIHNCSNNNEVDAIEVRAVMSDLSSGNRELEWLD